MLGLVKDRHLVRFISFVILGLGATRILEQEAKIEASVYGVAILVDR